MDYKSLMGYGNKKKKKSKSKQNKIVENIKSQLNDWNDDTFKDMPRRWGGASDKGLTEYEKERMNEGTAYEYKKHSKKIEKSLKDLQKNYLNFYETLRKKGLDDSAADFLDNYKKNVVGCTKKYKKDFGKLM